MTDQKLLADLLKKSKEHHWMGVRVRELESEVDRLKKKVQSLLALQAQDKRTIKALMQAKGSHEDSP